MLPYLTVPEHIQSEADAIVWVGASGGVTWDRERDYEGITWRTADGAERSLTWRDLGVRIGAFGGP